MEELRVARAWSHEHPEAPGLEWAPIQTGLEPPSSALVSGIRAVVLPGLGLLLLLVWEVSLRAGRDVLQGLSVPSATVSVDLAAAHPPAKVAPGPAPAGRGRVEGTDSIDPLLLRANVAPPPSDLADGLAAAGEGDHPPGRLPDNLDLSLPVAPGGTGWARGTGKDATRGGLRAELVEVKARFDHELVALHEEPAFLEPPYTPEEESVPVVVMLTIGADGVPTHARAISGPARRHAEAVAAALKWRFEALAPHGLTAPHSIRIFFYPKFVRRRR